MNLDYQNFLKPITENDNNLYVVNENKIVYTINPFYIENIYVSANILKINLKNNKVYFLGFYNNTEAKAALNSLQEHIDILTDKKPFNVPKNIKNYFEDNTINDTDLLPSEDNTYNIGSENFRWRDIYCRDIYAASESIYLGDNKISINDGLFSFDSTIKTNSLILGNDDDGYIHLSPTSSFLNGVTGATGTDGERGPALFTLVTNSQYVNISSNSVIKNNDSGLDTITTLEGYPSVFLTGRIISNDESNQGNFYIMDDNSGISYGFYFVNGSIYYKLNNITEYLGEYNINDVISIIATSGGVELFKNGIFVDRGDYIIGVYKPTILLTRLGEGFDNISFGYQNESTIKKDYIELNRNTSSTTEVNSYCGNFITENGSKTYTLTNENFSENDIVLLTIVSEIPTNNTVILKNISNGQFTFEVSQESGLFEGERVSVNWLVIKSNLIN